MDIRPDAGPVPYWRWENTETRCYYELRLTRGLWGDWHVLRAWGGIGCALGVERSELAGDFEAALRIVERTARRREQRGYAPR